MVHQSESGPVTTIDLLRHGEPVGGTRYRGTTDDPLSEAGWAQMWATVGDGCPWQRIATSPLARCAEFAEAMGRRWGLYAARVPALAEMDFGIWEGRPAREVLAGYPDEIRRFWANPNSYTPSGGEPYAQFEARLGAAWDALVEDYRGEHLLAVTHTGVIRALVCRILQVPYERAFRLDVPYACLTRIRIDRARGVQQPRIRFHGGGLHG